MKIFTELTNIEAELITGGCACSCSNRKTPLIIQHDDYECTDQASDYEFIGFVKSENICKNQCNINFFNHECTQFEKDSEANSFSFQLDLYGYIEYDK